MGGLVLDIYVVFLWKSIIRTIQFFGSLRWRRAVASLVNRNVQSPLFGCSTVRVYYRFESTPGYQVGEDEVPFCLVWDAKNFVERLPPGSTVKVRVRKGKTLFFRLDQ